MELECDTVPAWATERPQRATERQMTFLLSLVAERNLETLTDEQRRKLQEIVEGREIAKPTASRIIEQLLELPKAPTAQSNLPEIPAGRYAIEANDGELRFYKVWRSKNGYTKLYVLHGPDETQMNFKTMKTIVEKIIKKGVRECAIRYGLEIGQCSNCGRRLTNRISRELGIGPVCGGRMFGDDFSLQIKGARQAILARGEDPNEELE